MGEFNFMRRALAAQFLAAEDTKMELLQRQAYGFRNFQNYRLRVKVFFFDSVSSAPIKCVELLDSVD